MAKDDPVEDLLGFLSKDSPSKEIRAQSVGYLAGLTGTEIGRQFITGSCGPRLIDIFIDLLTDNHTFLRTNALTAIVNLSTDEKACEMLTDDKIIEILCSFVVKPPLGKNETAEKATMALSNLAHWDMGSKRIMYHLKTHKKTVFNDIIDKFLKSTTGMHHIASFLGNITQVRDARMYLLDKDKSIFQQLLSFVSFKDSAMRRNGVVSTIKNCCFETESHLWMLSDQINILPVLLMPLAGPEEFDDDDMDKLPMELQYLSIEKEREPEPSIRKMLIEALNQLVATKAGRKIVKDKNAYVILRELHNWEKDAECMVVLENLVSVLISDEPSDGMENLNEVIIPEDLKNKMDKNLVR